MADRLHVMMSTCPDRPIPATVRRVVNGKRHLDSPADRLVRDSSEREVATRGVMGDVETEDRILMMGLLSTHCVASTAGGCMHNIENE